MRVIGTLFGKMSEWSKKYANLPDRYIDRITERVRTFILYIIFIIFCTTFYLD